MMANLEMDGGMAQLSYAIAELEGVEKPQDAPLEGRCRICRLTGLGFSTSTVFSDSFTSANLLQGGDCICYRCRHLADHTDLRRYHWILQGDELRITKERHEILKALLNPPKTGTRWMVKVATDFLNTLNGWIAAQRLNLSPNKFRVLLDKELIHIGLKEFREMVDFARGLRQKDVAKRVLKEGPTAGDFERYDISFDEKRRIEHLTGKEDWNLVTRLVQ